MSERYNPFAVEEKWQSVWASQQVDQAEMNDKPKYYVLEMLPYPSGKLHMGHVRNYTVGDVLARYKKAQGFNVLHPMGADAFGLPAENAALKNGVHPEDWTRKNIAELKKGMQRFGWSYDWNRELATCDKTYYGHQQALFLDLYARELVYQKKAMVNWDPVDCTVLANEQVVDGKGWRSGAPVERREMTQWFLKITDYADVLLEDLEVLEHWPERVRTMQQNWIGRSEGLSFTFDIDGWDEGLPVFTTRPETIMGATYCAIAPEHPLAQKAAEHNADIQAFIREAQALGTAAEDIEKAEKKGIKTAFQAQHPVSGALLPIYIANFVLMGYGTGAIMGVPAHDERDAAFAAKYHLPVQQVIQPAGEEQLPYTGTEGVLVHSGEWSEKTVAEAREAVLSWFEVQKKGERVTNYRLRDWGISRQRYWGCPIPFIHCPSCGVVPVPAEQLPVTLPRDVTFDKPGNPLERHPTWRHDVTCPQCGSTEAVRETDTMDTFMDSSWYFLRYCCPQANVPIAQPETDYWMAVDQYIGGIEHAVLHLLYARFLTKALHDAGYTSVREPFKALLCQGMVLNNSYQSADGTYINPQDVETDGKTAQNRHTGEVLKVNRMEKVSKSKNNGIDPFLLAERYGVDTLRLFMAFAAPIERDLEWSDSGVEGAWRFLGRLWSLVVEPPQLNDNTQEQAELTRHTLRKTHQTIRKVGSDIEKFQLNTMISAVMELCNQLADVRSTLEKAHDDVLLEAYHEGVETAVRLLHPVVPFITEELWQRLGHQELLTQQPWPVFDSGLAKDDEITLIVQLNGKVREKLTVAADIDDERAKELALESLSAHLAGKNVQRCIVVPRRLVNVVA